MSRHRAAWKYRNLVAELAADQRVAVAFSGGVDSSLLLAAALAARGAGVLVLHARSPLQAAGEYERAMAVAAGLRCRPEVVDVDPYSWPDFVANPPERCYLCKKRLYSLFREKACASDCSVLLDGTNGDDLRQDRPGLRALQELQVRTPLADAGLTKIEIRRLAREQGLANWDKPSASCLATRIMAQQPITPANIALVGQGESLLQELGFTGARFRHYGARCLIEVARADEALLARDAILARIQSCCRRLGFAGMELGWRP
ncbi:ATP-dependent sacrificial sulfur transferase LarE [Desulfurivibrio sp. C05AmB]|uniref:ATP-dependent sacrificial sulfur transferase LarE n=1 Tax=Desulfurivibrio sp. C05AmB TaxID=3374371 RepID=UPI00376F13BB